MTGIVSRDVKGPETPGVKTVNTSLSVILGPVDLLRFDRKTFTVKNSGAVAFNACKVQATVIDGATADADWEDIDTATLQTLGAGAIKSVQVKDDSRKWWRVIASTGSSSTTAQAWLTAGAL